MKQKLRHIRAKDRSGAILSKGGATISAIVDDNDKVVKFAIAWCHSRDNFNRHTGKVKATGMMNSQLRSEKDTPEQDWNAVIDEVTQSVRVLQREALARDIDKLQAKQRVIERRVIELVAQYRNV